MALSGKKYIFLAFAGAAILGFGTYLLLNNSFQRIDVAVAANDIESGSKITGEDVRIIPYFRQALPEGYISDTGEITGKQLKMSRKKGDPFTRGLFSESQAENGLLGELAGGEVLIAVDVNYREPLLEELKIGNSISIVSTEKQKDDFYPGTSEIPESSITGFSDGLQDKSIMDINTFSLSENILVIDGQMMIKNLKVVDIRKSLQENNSLVSSGNKSSWYIFIRCSIKEAPAISRITQEQHYKIFLEKS